MRVSLDLVVRHPEAAADGDIEAGEASGGVDHRDVAEILREDVDVVARGHRDADLEFPRQVGGAVDRFRFRFTSSHEFVADPKLMVGAGSGQEVFADRARGGVDLGVQGGLRGVGVAHHVAVHVATRGDGIE